MLTISRHARIPEPFKRISRFVFSGGMGALTHFGILILMTELAGTGVILSTTTAFVAASGVSFSLQKVWTFKDRSLHAVPIQMLLYIIVALLNLVLNAALMYVLTEHLDLHYLAAQLITSGLIAAESYLLYKYVVFPDRSLPE